MTNQQQCIALYTLVRREWVRMFRIASQVFLPPVVTTSLYFLIFGALIGQRIGQVSGMEYAIFIAPGLIMMNVITNAYANVCASLFSVRFQKSIEEMLVSPMRPSLLLLGYTLGGILRGLIVAVLVFLVASFFLNIKIYHLPLTLMVVAVVSALFSLAGFTNALIAKTFDDVAIVPTFVLTPLSYLGGVFYSLPMLSPFWQKICLFNPVFYMVSALRYAMTGYQEVHISLALLFTGLSLTAMVALNLYLLKKGTGLRD